MAKLIEAFGPELTKEAVNAFMRLEPSIQAFAAFFKGESSSHMFVYYQPELAEGEVGYFKTIFVYCLLCFSNFNIYFPWLFVSMTTTGVFCRKCRS